MHKHTIVEKSESQEEPCKCVNSDVTEKVVFVQQAKVSIPLVLITVNSMSVGNRSSSIHFELKPTPMINIQIMEIKNIWLCTLL